MNNDDISSHPVSHHTRIYIVLGVIICVVFLAFVVIMLRNQNTQEEIIPLSTPPTPTSVSQTSSIDLQSEYENPFDQNTQYVNPFSEYKNPFDTLE